MTGALAGSLVSDYALIGDLTTAALVGRNGSIDWLCLPRFDSPACFAAALGSGDRGRWQIAPADPRYGLTRRYREASLVVETDLTTATGQIRLIDFMPPGERDPAVVRIVEGLSGRVDLTMDLRPRFGYGRSVPAVEQIGGVWRATTGPDALWLQCSVRVRGDGSAAFSVGEGEQRAFILRWRPSHIRTPPVTAAAASLLAATDRHWSGWAARLRYTGSWTGEVVRSLVTIRALTHRRTGGVLAAPTTALPDSPGTAPSVDDRCCRLSDASATLDVLLHAGVLEDAVGWRDWLLRATAGPPQQIQGVYGPAGERYGPDGSVDSLTDPIAQPIRKARARVDCGWPVAAGELLRASFLARRAGLPSPPVDIAAFLNAFELRGAEADGGLWGSAGRPLRHVYSRAMAWAGGDAMIKMIEWYGHPGDSAAWQRLCAGARTEIMRHGVDRDRGAFVRAYGQRRLDAALLRLSAIGFIAADDPLLLGTVRAVREDLADGPLIRRYASVSEEGAGGLPVAQHAFVACTFWLAEALAIAGRMDEANDVFEAGLALRTDLGLIAEQHDIRTDRPAGNFPATSAHVAMVGAALRLDNPTRRAIGSGLEAFFPR